MSSLSRQLIAVGFLALLTLVAVAAKDKSGSPKHLVMMVLDSSVLPNEVLCQSWLSYTTSRYAQLIDEYPPPTRAKQYRRDYEREVKARTALAHNYRNIKRDFSGGPNPYLEELVLVYESDFMREYVWSFLRDDSWSKGPKPERLALFGEWMKSNLPDHKAETRAWAEVRYEVPLLGRKVEFSVPARWVLESVTGDKKTESARFTVPLLGAAEDAPRALATVTARRLPVVQSLQEIAGEIEQAIGSYESLKDNVPRGGNWRTLVGRKEGQMVVEHHVAMLNVGVLFQFRVPGENLDAAVIDKALSECEQFPSVLSVNNNRFFTNEDLGALEVLRVEY